MKPDDVKLGETYVNEGEDERTVVEIRPGTFKVKQHIMFVKYTSPDSSTVKQARLKEFAKWAKGPKINMPVHICDQKRQQGSWRCSVKYDPHDRHWLLSIRGYKTTITYCPFCGDELHTPQFRGIEVNCPDCNEPMIYVAADKPNGIRAEYLCVNIKCKSAQQ